MSFIRISSSVLFEFCVSLGILKFTYAMELKNLASAKKQKKKQLNASITSSPILTSNSINTVDLKALMKNNNKNSYQNNDRDSKNFNYYIDDEESQVRTASFF